jgi:predicted nicotinamide N-methyase
LWKITPLLAKWLATRPEWLQNVGVLTSISTVVELGCGITGLLGIVLAEHVGHYILTDQEYVMKALRDNVHQASTSSGSKTAGNKKKKHQAVAANLHLKALDWELDEPGLVLNGIADASNVDLVIVCDCVYNEHLIKPLIQTLVGLVKVGTDTNTTTIMIAQQLRSDIIFEAFLEALQRLFKVWRILDSRLPEYLHSKSGFVVHLAQLNQEAG